MKRCLAVLIALSIVGCRAITGDDFRRERRLGVIEFHGQTPVLQVPATVASGTEFEVVVTTYGGGCVDRGDTDVTATAAGADIRPYDIFLTSMPDDHVCTDVLNSFSHRAILRFTQPGRVTLRFHGRAEPSNAVIVVERQITVE